MARGLLLLLSAAVVLSVIVPAFAGEDYYRLLGVKRDATQRQIKKAYRELSLKYHPDKNRGDKAAHDKFVEVGNAYQVLSDQNQRRVYDQYGEEGLKKQGQGGARDPFDLFQSFGGFGGGGGPFQFNFGGQRRGGSQQHENPKGPELEIPLLVTLEDLYLGKTMRVLHRKQVLCSKCRGTGAKDPEKIKKCPHCKGTGVVVKTQQLGPGFIQHVQTACDHCGGKGQIYGAKCPHCKGKKVESGEDTLVVEVERGMPDGHKITYEEEGDVGPEMDPGDVIFKIVTQPDARFKRLGDDLEYHTTISLREALVGFKKTIKHLDGRMVPIERRSVTKPGHVEKIKEEGMPQHNYPSETGDLFVHFTVMFPDKITDKQREGFEKLLR